MKVMLLACAMNAVSFGGAVAFSRSILIVFHFCFVCTCLAALVLAVILVLFNDAMD